MTKIEFFSLHSFRNNEHFQYMTDVDHFITTATPLELGIGSIYPPFKTALVAEDATMRTELGSIRSKAIEDFDKLRDKTWKAILLRVESTLLSPFYPEVESAQVIKRMIDLYGDVRAISYNEESAAISNLVNDLMLPANIDHLSQAGITIWVIELRMQNEQFQILFNERNEEFADRESGDVRAIRFQIDPLYEKIVERINATLVMEIAKPAAITFVSQLNEKIKYYHTTLASRAGRVKATKALKT